MNGELTEDLLITDVKAREKLVERVEVLERVKGLLLLPVLEKATKKQVCAFYKIEEKALNQLLYRHKEELEGDGYATFKADDIHDDLLLHNVIVSRVSKRGLVELTFGGETHSFSYKGTGLFPHI